MGVTVRDAQRRDTEELEHPMFGVFAGFEREMIIDRVINGMEREAAKFPPLSKSRKLTGF
jgi:hypothetical protein